MAKRGVKSQKYKKNKGFAKSYYEPERSRPTTIDYMRVAEKILPHTR